MPAEGRHFGEEEHVKINIELDKALEETEVIDPGSENDRGSQRNPKNWRSRRCR